MRTQAVTKFFAKKCELRMYKDGDPSELKASNRLTKNHVEHYKMCDHYCALIVSPKQKTDSDSHHFALQDYAEDHSK